MRFVAFILSLCLTMNVIAASTGQLQLERELDEYNYALSVEWDQKDWKFYEAETEKFLIKLSYLMREQGLTPNDLTLLSEKKIKNKAVLDAVKHRVERLGPNSSEADLIEILKQTSTEFYSQGASWNGMAVLLYGGGLVLLAAITYHLWVAATTECVQKVEEYKCISTSTIDVNGLVTVVTDCGPKASCVAWAKK